MALYDISRSYSPVIATWPGDTPFHIEQVLSQERGDSVTVSSLRMSTHVGTHVDAPLHFDTGGAAIDQLALLPFWGLAQVVTVSRNAGPLTKADFEGRELDRAPRLLVHSPSSQQPDERFPTEIVFPGPELAADLQAAGVILYGTDAPSVDRLDDPQLPGHHALAQAGIAILEGLNLAGVPDGLYELASLPLKLVGSDGSPVRAVLRSSE